MVGEIMGTGILGLPYACSRLGWVMGLVACVMFGATAIYSGVLLARVKNDFFPGADSYGDLAHATVGPVFGGFTRGAIVLTWALLLPYYLICCVDSLLLAFPDAPMCFWQWTLVVEAGLLVPLQLRSLHLISYVSGGSVLAMVVAIVLILYSLAFDATEAATTGNVTHSLWPSPETSFLALYSSFGTFVFAYQGQSMFLEIMREMRDPRHFPRAVLAANGSMVVVYTLRQLRRLRGRPRHLHVQPVLARERGGGGGRRVGAAHAQLLGARVGPLAPLGRLLRDGHIQPRVGGRHRRHGRLRARGRHLRLPWWGTARAARASRASCPTRSTRGRCGRPSPGCSASTSPSRTSSPASRSTARCTSSSSPRQPTPTASRRRCTGSS